MERKLTPKQEKFCLNYIETGNASEAYRRAYNAERMKPATVNRKAKVEIDKGKIRARLESMQKLAQERHNITVDTLTTDLLEDRKLAHREGQAGAAVAATMAMAKLHGLLVGRKKHSGSIAVQRIERVIIDKGVTMKV